MPTVKTSDGFEVASNFETGDAMKAALTSPEVKVEEVQESAAAPAVEAKTPPVSTPPAADGTDTTPADGTPAGGRRVRETPQQRIDRAIAAQRDSEREAAFWKSKALGEGKEAKPAAPAAPARPPAPSPSHPGYDTNDPEPQHAEFADEPDPTLAYVRAIGAWSGRLEARASERLRARGHVQANADMAEQARAATMADRLAAGAVGGDKERLPEFLETISDRVIGLRTLHQLNPGERPTGETAVADYLVDSEHPHLLMKYLSGVDGEAELQRLSTLHPRFVWGQMGRIEERLVAAHKSGPAQGSVPVSRARAPIKPVAGSQQVVSDGAPKETDDLATFITKGNALDPRVNPKIAARR